MRAKIDHKTTGKAQAGQRPVGLGGGDISIISKILSCSNWYFGQVVRIIDESFKLFSCQVFL